jgi:tetraacyldisaccharide 4'-kinase
LLEDAGIEVIAHPLHDHADLGPEQLEFEEPGPVLITEKDAVKCEAFAPDDVWCVAVDLVFDSDSGARLLQVLTRNLGGRAV